MKVKVGKDQFLYDLIKDLFRILIHKKINFLREDKISLY
jgi:hypothetical protein